MAVAFAFSEVDRLVRITLEGEFSDDAVREGWSKLAKIAALYPGYRGIVDLSGITQASVSSNLIAMLARSPALQPDHNGRVIVAPNDVMFGIARMFQLRAESTRPNTHIVRTMDEAYEVLGVTSPTFVAITL